MKLPQTILEWIDERISFYETVLDSNRVIGFHNRQLVSDATILHANFKYCKRMYLLSISQVEDKEKEESKARFKSIAKRLIFYILYEIDKLEYKTFYIDGKAFPSTKKDNLPQEVFDDNNKIREMLSSIYNDVHCL